MCPPGPPARMALRAHLAPRKCLKGAIMRFSSVSLAVLLLAGCGGGGGDEALPPLGGTSLAITEANYQAVAQESVSSVSYVMSAADLVTGAQVGSDRVVLDFARRVVAKLPAWFAAVPPRLSGAELVEIQPCSGGGAIRVTLNDLNDNNDIDAGESAVAVATQCVEMDATINGTISVSFKSLSGDMDSGIYQMGVDLTLTSLSVAMPGASSVGNGSMSIDIAMTAPDTGRTAFSCDSLSLTGTYGTAGYARTMTKFSIVDTVAPHGTTTRSSMEISGSLSSSALESKAVTLSTVSPMVSYYTDPYPSSGVIVATGANNSKVRMTAQSATTVLIELDADGNGSYESSVSRLWSDLI